MNAETTTIVAGFAKAPGGKSPKHKQQQKGEPTHLHLIDEATGQKEQLTLSQLRTYGNKLPSALESFFRVGEKARPRRIINDFKKAKGYFTGENPIKKGSDGKCVVIPSKEWDALFEGIDDEISEELDDAKYDVDEKRDARQLELGIELFRRLLNSEERVKQLMVLFAGVMQGGANRKEGLWFTYLGYLKFILCGVAKDYEGKSRNEDGTYDLDHPHLSFSALATAIHQARVNLTSSNIIKTEEVQHQRTWSNRSRRSSTHSQRGSFHSQRRPSLHRASSFVSTNGVSSTPPHEFPTALKWILVIGLIEKLFTPALYEKLKEMEGEVYEWAAYNIGTMLAAFHISLGEAPPRPETKKDKLAKAAAAVAGKETSDGDDSEKAGSEPEKADEAVDSDSEESEDEGSPEEPAAAAEESENEEEKADEEEEEESDKEDDEEEEDDDEDDKDEEDKDGEASDDDANDE